MEYIELLKRKYKKRRQIEQMIGLFKFAKQHRQKINISKISRETGLSRPTVYKYLYLYGMKPTFEEQRRKERERLLSKLPKKVFVCMSCRMRFLRPKCPDRCPSCNANNWGVTEEDGRWVRPVKGTEFDDSESYDIWKIPS